MAKFRDYPYKKTEDGYACIVPSKGEFTKSDDEYGIPIVILKDIRDACFSFKALLKQMPDLADDETKKYLSEEMVRGYAAGLGDGKAFEEIGISNEKLIAVMAKVSERLIQKGGKFPSFQQQMGVHN